MGDPTTTAAVPADAHARGRPRVDWAGPPLRSTLRFLAVPASLALAVLLLDAELPSFALYGVGGAVGLLVVSRMFRDPEWLLAAFILYIPLTRQFVVPIAPGINATNIFLILLVLAWASHARADGRPMFVAMPTTKLVGTYAVVTLLSVVTAAVRFGFGEVLDSNGGDIKGWIDQFVVFFAFVYLIRDGAMARRVVLYMMLGALVVLAFGFNEWLDKRWLDSIEKARLLGPQMQPNDFGAFLVYIAGPFLALFLIHARRVRAWVALPYFLVLAKMLLATFSRGAFIGMAVGGVAAGYVRGRAFLLAMALLGAGLLVAVPSLIPESLSARMSSTVAETDTGAELDASSENRIVLWEAAVVMSLESPLLGKGFKAFPRLKAGYTGSDVREADNHNMFLYLSSQMGIPALVMFLMLLYGTWRRGVQVYRAAPETFGGAIGLGAAAMVASAAAINMFGSRVVDMSVCSYLWIYMAALVHLWLELAPQPDAESVPAPAPWRSAPPGVAPSAADRVASGSSR